MSNRLYTIERKSKGKWIPSDFGLGPYTSPSSSYTKRKDAQSAIVRYSLGDICNYRIAVYVKEK
jgi:hypothetical protein